MRVAPPTSRTTTTWTYGFWLKTTTTVADGTTYNEVETFARSSVDASDSHY